MFLTIINCLVIILHLFLIFSPILLFFLNIPRWFLKYYLTVPVLTYSHWKLFDNQCILTIFQKNIGFINKNSNFSETYLSWFYKPIMKLLNIEWNMKNLDVVIHMHWVINFFIIWYFTFF
jgi:hypothetical protein